MVHARRLTQFAPLVLVAVAGAQTQTASVAGRVVDTHGKAVPQAQLTVRNTDVGTTRTLHADAAGSFRVSGLSPGAYSVEASGGGLVLRPAVRLTLTLGSSTDLVLQMRIPPAKQSTTVTARRTTVEGNTVAPTPNTAEAAVGTFLPGLTITYLPNRDRDYTQFTTQAAGAELDVDGAGLSIAGQRGNAIAVALDGTSFNDPLEGGIRGGQDGSLFLPLTAVREFELLRSGVDSAVAVTGAAALNVATKFGVNRSRGEAFYTGRPANFTSADAFGHGLDGEQNAFGASYSGPIRKDHAFYSFSLEQDFVHAGRFVQFAPQAPGVVVPAGLTGQQAQTVERQRPTALFTRLDFVLNSANTLAAAFGWNRIDSKDVGDPFSRTLATEDHSSSLGGHSVTTRIALTSVLGPRALNQATFAYANDHRTRTPNAASPELFVNGFGVLGGNSDGVHRFTSQGVQVLDDLTLTRGRNEFTFGARVAAAPASEYKEQNSNGRFDYNSLQDVLANNARRFRQTFNTGDTVYRGTVTELGLYANARVAIRPGLSLTAGLRYAGQWNPQPPNPNGALPLTRRISNDLRQWQPRLGLAWSGSSKTVVRVSSGIYDAPTPAAYFHRVFSDSGTQTVTIDSDFDPVLLALSGATSGTPHALGAAPAGLQTAHAEVAGIAPNFRNPRTLQAAASVDRQVAAKLEVTLGYLHGSTWAAVRRLDENLAAPTVAADGTTVFNAPRPLAGYGRVLVAQSNAHASYDGGFVSLNSQISRRSQLLFNYTLSRTRSDSDEANPYSPIMTLNPFDLRQERSFSTLDARHTFNLNAIVNLPVGFKLNPLLLARTGLPYTPIVGFDTQGDANDWNDRVLRNGAAVPRNIDRQPVFSSLDLRVVKDFTLKGEGHHLDLFMDVFNLYGAGNRRFDADSVSLFGNAARPVYSAGVPLFSPGVAQVGGPRTIQFTARLVGF